jgi:hypothetical protein
MIPLPLPLAKGLNFIQTKPRSFFLKGIIIVGILFLLFDLYLYSNEIKKKSRTIDYIGLGLFMSGVLLASYIKNTDPCVM